MKLLARKKILIRLAKPEDTKIITELQTTAIETLCKENYSLQQIQALTQNKNRRQFWDEIIFIAEQEGQVVGFASLLSCREIINGIYVAPNLTRQGIGTQLLNALEKEAIRRKISILNVNSSLTSQAFYAARSYKTIANCNFWKMGIPIPCIAMRKQLINRRGHWSLSESLPQIAFASITNILFLLLAV